MPTRNPSSRSLRADIAVLNPTTGKMEFPKAERTDFPLSQKVIDYKRAEYDWLVKNADYEHSFEYFFKTAPSSVMALSRKQGSQERIAELEETVVEYAKNGLSLSQSIFKMGFPFDSKLVYVSRNLKSVLNEI